jgi:hypothetical protein
MQRRAERKGEGVRMSLSAQLEENTRRARANDAKESPLQRVQRWARQTMGTAADHGKRTEAKRVERRGSELSMDVGDGAEVFARRRALAAKVPVIPDGEWVRPVYEGYSMVCCDCGLEHLMDFRIGGDGGIEFRAFRKSPPLGAKE